MRTPRPSWEEYGTNIATAVATRSEDPYVKVGAVVMRQDNSVAGCGYNGAPSGIVLDWADRDLRRPYVLHAEMNALTRVTREPGLWIASTHISCIHCLPVVAAYGIRRFVYLNDLGVAHDIDQIHAVAHVLKIYLERLS